MKFNKAKSKILHVSWVNHKPKYKLNRELIESSLVEKDLGVLMYEKLNMTRHCVLADQKAKEIVGSIKSSLAISSGFPIIRRTWTCWSESRGGHRDDQRSGVPLLGRQAERVGFFSLEKRRLQEDLTAPSSTY
ncbi:hypothetical protein WISP_103722 [Willisornis vidua]|uniref:Uncharacterized protein n=1 Tax=Willisornis vidua TaxID=1566151 RepID=A0ABQ9D3J4_9PASS|nr:hypothetical protein WISP_103722 [Willisornis vidua]